MEAHARPPAGAGSGVLRDWAAAQRPATVVLAAGLVALVLLAAAAAAAVRAGPPAQRSKACPPRVPFWLPFLGHAPHMAVDPNGFLARLRDRYPEGVFSLRLCGRLHHFVHGPSMAVTLLNRPRTTAEAVSSSLLVSNFGFSERDRAHHATMADESRGHFRLLLSEPGLGDLVDACVGHVRRRVGDLVRFGAAADAQPAWARLAGAEPVGRSVVAADLTELTRNFVAMTANRALFGSDFVDNFPDLWRHLWTFDDAFLLLAARIPGWVPWPRLRRARAAQRRILAHTREFNEAMDRHLAGHDAGARWRRLDDVSAVVTARLRTWRRHGLSMEARASSDLALAWAMNANANQLVPWMLFELYRDPALLARVRDEVRPFVSAAPADGTVEHVDVDGLLARCPHLKAAYIETLRLYTGTWTMRRLREDVVLGGGRRGEPYLLPKGSFAHVAQEMHQLDPGYFPSPREWHHERHLREHVDDDGRRTLVADMGTLRPYGGGPAMCKGRTFALREMLLYAAIIVSLYDMQPPDGQGWPAPETYKLVATRHPKTPIRVRISRRAQADGRGERGA